MKTPLEEFYEFMEQNQYYIGNDLYNKYNELLDKQKEGVKELEFLLEKASRDRDYYYELWIKTITYVLKKYHE